MSTPELNLEWTEAEMRELEQNLGRQATPAERRASIDAIARAGVRLFLARQKEGKVLPFPGTSAPAGRSGEDPSVCPHGTLLGLAECGRPPCVPRTLSAVRNLETRTATCVEYAVVCVYSDGTEETVWGRTVPLSSPPTLEPLAMEHLRIAIEMRMAGVEAWANQSKPAGV